MATLRWSFGAARPTISRGDPRLAAWTGGQRAALVLVTAKGERRALRQVADALADLERVFDRVEPQHLDRSFGGLQQVEHRANRRRLAGAVLAQQAEDRALGHVDREVVDGGDVPVLLGEVGDFDHGSIVATNPLIAHPPPAGFPTTAAAVHRISIGSKSGHDPDSTVSSVL